MVRLVHPTECEGSKSLLDSWHLVDCDAHSRACESTTRMSTDSDTNVLSVIERTGPTGGGLARITRCEQAGAGWGGHVVRVRG